MKVVIKDMENEQKKLKAEVNDYFHGLNAVGKIDYKAYSELYDVCMPILDKCYDRMKAERKDQSFTFLDKATPFCDTPFFDEKYECIQIHDSAGIVGFCGKCKVKNGDVVSLDGDSYYKEMTVIAYNEFSSKENKLCLDILVEDW